MIHTLTITHEIKDYRIFNAIFSSLNPRKEKEGSYVSYRLNHIGMREIRMIKRKTNEGYRYMYISIRLNPSVLINRDKSDITEAEHIYEVKRKFDYEIKKIYMGLPEFEYWIVKRIDYAINVYTPLVEEYIKLFQRGDKSKYFLEPYCSKSKIRKQLKGSFYLKSSSTNINFYDKKYESISKGTYDEKTENLLRLEIQCKKPKVNTIKIKYDFENNSLLYFLNSVVGYEILNTYYTKMIGRGRYYKLNTAIKLIKESSYTDRIKDKLINVLKEVNKHRSVWKARDKSQYKSESFNRYLKMIREIDVNPVTIPNRWKVDELDNIFDIVNVQFKIEENKAA